MLTVAGLQLPVIPLSDVFGSAGTVPPEQMVSEVPKLNVGVTFGFTVTVNVAGMAHSPAAGVNVYTSDAVLLTVAGFQVPFTPFVEVAGRAGTVAPEQIVSAVPKENEGVIFWLTVTVNVTGTAQGPGSGVKV